MESNIYGNLGPTSAWTIAWGPKEYGISLCNKRGYSHKRTNKKRK